MEKLATVDTISKSFETEEGEQQVLRNISFDIFSGELLCIVGPSGCGKSTFLRILAGTQVPSSGTFKLEKPTRISFVFQQFALFPWFTVAENISFPLKMSGVSSKNVVSQLINEVGLSGAENKHPKELSGGMKQRVGIARALAPSPDLIFLDEPFSALDTFTAQTLRKELLSIWKTHKMTIVLVTHSVEEAVDLADRVLVMKSGRIIEEVKVSLTRPRNERSKQFFALVDKIVKSLHI